VGIYVDDIIYFSTSDAVEFNITIINNTLKFNTYQKPLNLYLYIPPFSSYPQVVLKDLYLEKSYATGFKMMIQPSSLSSPNLSNAS